MSGMIKFKASSDQISQIALLAINASEPVGLGFLLYQPRDFTLHDMSMVTNPESIDYFEGRMVKLNIRPLGDGYYSMQNKISIDYQSWGKRYPVAYALLESAGITEMELQEF
jgi:hypothetical protein